MLLLPPSQAVRQPTLGHARFRQFAYGSGTWALLPLLLLATLGCKSERITPTPDQASNSNDSQPLQDRANPPLVVEVESETDSAPMSPEAASGDLAAAAGLDDTEPELPTEAVAGSWTRQRMFALAPRGPVIIELAVSIDGVSLDEAMIAATQELARELFTEEDSLPWQKLLEHPLIQSGWLGNLVAEADQTDQLVGMYDTDANKTVEPDELSAFLSRGLARNAALQVRDAGAAPNPDVSKSPWGVSDQNQDYSLSPSELADMTEVLAQFDTNNDAILASSEIDRSSGMQMQDGMSSTSMLDTNTLLIAEDLDSEDTSTSERARRRIGRDILEHYTFLAGLPRDQWTAWQDERWQQLDEDEDGLLDQSELASLAGLEADSELIVRFPAMDAADEAEIQIWHQANPVGQSGTWCGTERGGQLVVGSCVLNLEFDDSFSVQNKRLLYQRFDTALREPNLRTFFEQRLGLQGDDAFKMMDEDEDEKLSEAEFKRVWRWLTIRQANRLQGRWTTTARPWFQLLDKDADSRLTEAEVNTQMESLFELDADRDGLITPNELPLLVGLQLRRTDTRLDLSGLGLPTPAAEPPADLDWFSAMDANRDGTISRLEFLGDADVFQRLDSDSDSFLTRVEATAESLPHH